MSPTRPTWNSSHDKILLKTIENIYNVPNKVMAKKCNISERRNFKMSTGVDNCTLSGHRPESFSVLNGVKYGCVFSPVLFCIYLDGLLCMLAESKMGCFIGNVFVDALAYADIIALLAPTTRAMRLMLGICYDFAQEYAIVFNAKKSKYIWVKHRSTIKVASDRKPQFVIGDSVIEYVDSWPHLGHIIASSNDDNLDILNRRNSLY